MIYKVESKYKNPDRFIERLRRDFIRTCNAKNGARATLHGIITKKDTKIKELIGESVCKWTPHESTQKTTTATLATLNPLDKIAIIGTVVEVSSRNGSSAMIYTVEETRRIGKETK